MDGLNSYYLLTDKFVEHLQGEIGTGCIYFKSSTREILVYFDEMDIINGVIQDSRERAKVSPTLLPVFEALKQRNSWDVVIDLRMAKKFRKALSKWNYKSDLEGRGYAVIK